MRPPSSTTSRCGDRAPAHRLDTRDRADLPIGREQTLAERAPLPSRPPGPEHRSISAPRVLLLAYHIGELTDRNERTRMERTTSYVRREPKAGSSLDMDTGDVGEATTLKLMFPKRDLAGGYGAENPGGTVGEIGVGLCTVLRVDGLRSRGEARHAT